LLIVLAVAVPLISIAWELPFWLSLVLIVGAVFAIGAPYILPKRRSDPKREWLQLLANQMKLKSIYATLRESPKDATARARFNKLAAECQVLLESRKDTEWGTESSYVAKVREEIAALTAAAEAAEQGLAPVPSAEIARLTELWNHGLMAEPGFRAFSDRFKVMPAEKARKVLDEIDTLRLQSAQGEMTEEDYHVALWGLLERVDRGEQRPDTEKPGDAAGDAGPAGTQG